MADTVNIGMIGAGFIGQQAHLVNYAEIDRCRIVALAELRPKLRRQVCDRFGIPRSYSSHHELLADQEVEAVVVVTPRRHTAPVVLDCLEAGRHVLSEKPQACTSEQAQLLVDCAERNDLVYAVGYMKRHDEGVQVARQLLGGFTSSGELGPLLFARAHCFGGDDYCRAFGHVVSDEVPTYPDEGWPPAPGWVPEQFHQGFASYVNTFSHNTNLLRFLFGEMPDVEYARVSAGGGQLSVLRFGDRVVSLETGSSSARGWDESVEVFFADGRVTLHTPPALLRNVPAKVTVYRAGKIQEITSPLLDWTWSFRRQAEAFVDDVLEKREPLSSGRDAMRDLRLIEDLWKWDLERR